MIPFLKSIAVAYTSRYEDLSEFCFLFPNKRSGTFFLKYLKEECGEKPMIAPQVLTITDFVAQLGDKVVASSIDILFMLFKEYRNYADTHDLKGEERKVENKEKTDEIDFESFRCWGETVISDFDLVDRYLVNANELFKNVKDFRELSANFLTEEQKEVMERYFGQTDYGDPEEFWKDFENEESLSELKKRFVYLWRLLSPLYYSLHERLCARGLTTPGGAYRLACKNLEERGKEILPWKKVVVIGFNALSTSEYKLFKELKDTESKIEGDTYCDFFWDATGPVLTQKDNSASRFVMPDMINFPMPEWSRDALQLSSTDIMPKIRVISASSNSSQVKIVEEILEGLDSQKDEERINGAEVAVVLPDESLLLPLLYSIPSNIETVNLTMGYSFRYTSIATFIALLRRLYRTMRMEMDMPAFFSEDLIRLISHPFSYMLFGGDAIERIRELITRHHKIILKLSDIKEKVSHNWEIFRMPSGDTDAHKVTAYLSDVIERIDKALTDIPGKRKKLERSHLRLYIEAVRHFDDAIKEHEIEMTPLSAFRIIDRLLANTQIGFEGEPLRGLQVMGTLETRAIDFRNLVVLSVNEKIMPGKMRSRSFIPDTLRRAYGLPPTGYSEEIFAYYFYRMISRAKNVTLIYDARTSSGRAGGVSRYIQQLRHLFAKGEIKEEEWTFNFAGKEERSVNVEKTAVMKEMLLDFMKPGGRNLSSSTLSDYRKCQVKFFYTQLLGLDSDPERGRYIDAITVGDILHKVMEAIYLPEDKRGKMLEMPEVVTKSYIKSILSNKPMIMEMVTQKTNEIHFHITGKESNRPLEGAALLVAQRIVDMVEAMLSHDLEIAPFKIWGVEIKETLRIPFPSGKIINFKFAIDRLDEITDEEGNSTLRIVDYKTGSEKLESSEFNEIFSGNYKSDQIFQLMTYAWLLNKRGMAGAENVRMEIYSVSGMLKGETSLPKIMKEAVKRYGEYGSEFDAAMANLVESIFESPDFKETEDPANCSMCAFKDWCKR